MITAVDTSVLLDVFKSDTRFGAPSALALKRSRAEGALIASDVVWAEVTAAFHDVESAVAALGVLGVTFVALSEAAGADAGRAWREYRMAGGARDRVMSDFLIAAHAVERADRLLTWDRGFFRRYFSGLQVLDPSSGT